MAEWLRCWTRNPMGSSRTGSNPVRSVKLFGPLGGCCVVLSWCGKWVGWQGCDGRVVKALDSKSNGIFPHRFEPCSQRKFLLPFAPFIPIPHSCLLISLSIPLKSGISWVSSSLLAWQKPSSCDGRVVKALDSKSNGIFPHRFEPCSQH